VFRCVSGRKPIERRKLFGLGRRSDFLCPVPLNSLTR